MKTFYYIKIYTPVIHHSLGGCNLILLLWTSGEKNPQCSGNVCSCKWGKNRMPSKEGTQRMFIAISYWGIAGCMWPVLPAHYKILQERHLQLGHLVE